MKRLSRFFGIILIAALFTGSWAIAKQAGQDSCSMKDNSGICCKTECCKAECCKKDCCKADCCKADCCKTERCSMKSDSTKQCCGAMMHGSKKHEMDSCKKSDKSSCGKSMMKKRDHLRSGKAKAPKSPEPKKADK